MKKKIFICIALLLLCCSCGNKKTINDYIKDVTKNETILDKTTVNNYVSPSNYDYDDEPISGILSIDVDDFNNDKIDEVVIARIDSDDITLSLYELDNDKLVEKDSIVLVDDYLSSGSILDCYAFSKKIDGVKYLFFEATSVNSFFADGILWNYFKVSVNNSKLDIVSERNTSGSYFNQEELNKFIDYVRKTGLDVSEIVLGDGKYLVEQDSNVNKIFKIKRSVYDNLLDVDIYSIDDNESINYGKTEFLDYTR